jgi:hypothetical protein
VTKPPSGTASAGISASFNALYTVGEHRNVTNGSSSMTARRPAEAINNQRA